MKWEYWLILAFLLVAMMLVCTGCMARLKFDEGMLSVGQDKGAWIKYENGGEANGSGSDYRCAGRPGQRSDAAGRAVPGSEDGVRLPEEILSPSISVDDEGSAESGIEPDLGSSPAGSWVDALGAGSGADWNGYGGFGEAGSLDSSGDK